MASASTVVWRVTPAEHLRAVTDLQRYYSKRVRRLTRELRVLALALLALGAAFAIAWRWRASGEFPLGPTVTAVSFAAIVAAALLLRPWFARRAARRQLETNPLATQQRRYTFEQSGVRIAGETFSDDLAWNDIRHIGETPEFFLIFSQRSAYYLPKRAIVWPETIEGLREVFSEGIGARAKVR